jgi:hypothetical protein
LEHVNKSGDFSYILVELWLLRISKKYNGVSISTLNFYYYYFFGYITYSQAPRGGGGSWGTHVLEREPLQAMDDMSEENWMRNETTLNIQNLITITSFLTR